VEQRGGQQLRVALARLLQRQHHTDWMDDIGDIGALTHLIAVRAGGEDQC
jgi:hypothetical protein